MRVHDACVCPRKGQPRDLFAGAYAERLFIIAGTASTVNTPANISADAANILTVMGSPMKIMPAAEPNIPEVERRIATWVAEVYF